VIGLITGVLAAFWFGSIAKRVKKEAVARTKEDLAREREKLRVSVEQEKSKIIEQTHKKIVKETNRAHARANLKVGAALVGTLGLGGVMLLTQFVIPGLITLTLGGGVLGGYVWSVRRNRIARRIADQGRVETAAPAGVTDLSGKTSGATLSTPRTELVRRLRADQAGSRAPDCTSSDRAALAQSFVDADGGGDRDVETTLPTIGMRTR